MAALQEGAHGAGFDYEPGSPHLSHPRLRGAILDRIRGLVHQQFERAGRCRVLEIGAGHGAFTDHVVAMGAEVTVTEMSRPSLELLRERYRHNDRAGVLFDPDGAVLARLERRFDLVLCVSVLHHIPDYSGFAAQAVSLLDEGGAFASFQDPMWYPRLGAGRVRLDRAMYLAWRVGNGQLRRGVRTQLRRWRGVLDESDPSDMVEYHVVRQGVDEQALATQLRGRFDQVELWEYFSSQGRWMHALGTRWRRPQTFALLATGYRPTEAATGSSSGTAPRK